ncbi:hypothetical protein QUW45_08275 [Limosilactobacillus pontis]|uniref:hypothetical protein n=1 Tax=Limosilactobacillus pontis TaxID=35787 RepID=UPI0025A41E92|nr:hypothetical protein [Limosilactobacillus pontis]MDM8332657.1 hypothetical protein [Limosilactobacillus pontis]
MSKRNKKRSAVKDKKRRLKQHQLEKQLEAKQEKLSRLGTVFDLGQTVLYQDEEYTIKGINWKEGQVFLEGQTDPVDFRQVQLE